MENETNEIINAPFTDEQVTRLNVYQKSGIFHPFTCGSGNRKDSNHLDNEGLLVATTAGWICPYCDYKQDWCHTMMVSDECMEYIKQRLLIYNTKHNLINQIDELLV